MDRVRVLLADDHAEFLSAVVRVLGSEYEVVAAVGEGQEMLTEAARLEPDVLVIVISMPVLNGIAAAHLLRAGGSGAKVVFLTAQGDPDSVRAAFVAGAQGNVVKCRLVSDLPPALRNELAGQSFVSPSIVL